MASQTDTSPVKLIGLWVTKIKRSLCPTLKEKKTVASEITVFMYTVIVLSTNGEVNICHETTTVVVWIYDGI